MQTMTNTLTGREASAGLVAGHRVDDPEKGENVAGSTSPLRRRGCALAALVLALVSVSSGLPARADSTNFTPAVIASLGTDAARAPSSFSLKITQPDGQEQIGKLAIALPQTGAFTVDTDVPGSDGAQIGTIRVVLYTDPRPGRLTIDGTLHDDNARSLCVTNATIQCIVAKLNVAGQTVTAKLEIREVDGTYSIEGDLTSTWASDEVSAIDARLAELSTTLFANVASHNVVRNPPTAGTWPLTYRLESAAVPGRSVGGREPACAPSCKVDLGTREYAPTAPTPAAPAHGAAQLSSTPVAFAWHGASDANGDAPTYTLVVDDTLEIPTGAATTASLSLSPGAHTWRVRADDGHGHTSTSPTWTVTTVDATRALRFHSTSGDDLFVDPALHAFVYRLADGREFGAVTSSASGPTGYIAFNGAFTLAVAYDDPSRSAAGTFLGARLTRPFLDTPDA